jgi:DNA repair and recombination protein RAD52
MSDLKMEDKEKSIVRLGGNLEGNELGDFDIAEWGRNAISAPPEVHEFRGKLTRKVPLTDIERRTGPGGNSVPFLSGATAIRTANEIFGPDMWANEVKELHVVTKEVAKEVFGRDGKKVITKTFETQARVHMRVYALGTFHEDFGHHTMETSDKNTNEENAIKAATTDALKRCLRLFGDALGNCLYDKKFIQEANTIYVKNAKK